MGNETAQDLIAGICRFAKGHHGDQPSHLWLHALTVDIPSMCEAALAVSCRERPFGPCEVCWTNSWVPVPADDPDAQPLLDGSGFVRCDHCWLEGYARALREQLAEERAKC